MLIQVTACAIFSQLQRKVFKVFIFALYLFLRCFSNIIKAQLIMNRMLFSLFVVFSLSACTAQEKKSALLPLDENTKAALAQDSTAKALYEKVEAAASSGDKVSLIAAYLNFGNYMMFKSSVSPRQKYRPALKAYNAVLALQPDNPEAAKNKKTIEDIYIQMGLPIPKD